MSAGRGSRAVPWVAFVLGAAASIAANVAHAAARAETIGAGGMLAAAWAPVALLLVAEMVTRGTRPTGVTAVIQWSGTAVVAAVAAVVSYGHMRDLLLSYGETVLVAHILPLSVDGLLLVASVALARPADTRYPARSQRQRADIGADTGSGQGDTGTLSGYRNGTDRAAVAAPVPLDDEDGKGPHDVRTPGVDEGGHDAPPPGGPDDRAAARAAYRAALAAGVPPTGKDLAAAHGRSASWGRARIRECRIGSSQDLTDSRATPFEGAAAGLASLQEV